MQSGSTGGWRAQSAAITGTASAVATNTRTAAAAVTGASRAGERAERAPVDRPATYGAKPRFEWMDMLRGSAIILVLLWHAPAIPALFGAAIPAGIRDVNMFFLPFRMPTLMFLSGLLLPASMRKPLPVYYAGKFSMIVWPYVIWVIVDRLILGSAHPWWHWRAWYATSYLWFLFFIGVYYAIAPMLRKLPLWLPVAAFGTASLFLDHLTEQKLTYFAVFFFLGNLMAHKPDLLARFTRGWVVKVMAVFAVGYGVLSSIEGLAIAYEVVWAPLSVAGIFTAIGITRRLAERGTKIGWLTMIGRNSLVYYVIHFPVMVGTTFALYAVGVHDIMVVAVVNLVVAMSAAWLAVRFRSVRPITWLFQAPAVLTEWVRRRGDRIASAPRVVAAG